MESNVVKVFVSGEELAEDLALNLISWISIAEVNRIPITIALSGGTTPRILFRLIAEKYVRSLSWNHVHFFWGDERCVPPDDSDSNYGMTKELLLSKISIPEINIHRIFGENNPDIEAERYSGEIKRWTRSENNIPRFNIMILGMGDDGHVASIFPGNMELLKSPRVCEVALHPVSGQKRITLTGKVINNSERIIFLVTGRSKANILRAIFNREPISATFPATHISPARGDLIWMLDQMAGEDIHEPDEC